jgi:hypothetical protein
VCPQVRDQLAAGDAALFYSCFRHLAARPDAELRRACAAQLVPLMRAPLPGAAGSYFHDTWADMALDHDEQASVIGVTGLRTCISDQPASGSSRV